MLVALLVVMCVCFAWSAGFWMGRARRDPPEPRIIIPPPPPPPRVSYPIGPPTVGPTILMIEGDPHLPFHSEVVEVREGMTDKVYLIEQYRVGRRVSG